MVNTLMFIAPKVKVVRESGSCAAAPSEAWAALRLRNASGVYSESRDTIIRENGRYKHE